VLHRREVDVARRLAVIGEAVAKNWAGVTRGDMGLLAGTWLWLKLFWRIDEGTFRKIALALLLVSGVTEVL